MSSTSRDGILALSGSLMGLSSIAVGLRFYGRKQQHLRLLADDWTALSGVITYVTSCALIFKLVSRKDLGYSSTDFTAAELEASSEFRGKISYAFDFVNTTTLALVKLSALFFYRRVFHTKASIGDWFDRVVLTLVGIVICWYIGFQFLTAFQCHSHFAASWNGTSAKYCTLNFAWAMGLAVSDFLLDLIVLVLPIPRIWRLHTTTHKKLSIIGVLCLAFVGLGASVARIVVYAQTELGGIKYFFTHDPERTDTEIGYIQMLEAGISITAVNLPSLWRVCTSTLPGKMAHGIRSLRSMLGSSGHQRSRQASDDAQPIASAEEKTAVAGSARMVGIEEGEFFQEPTYPTPSHQTFRGRLEDQAFATSAMRQSNDREAGVKYGDDANSIV